MWLPSRRPPSGCLCAELNGQMLEPADEAGWAEYRLFRVVKTNIWKALEGFFEEDPHLESC